MNDISNSYLRLVNSDNGEEISHFENGSDLSKETAIVVGELYRHNGEWKFNAFGSGFYGGLAALCTNFGLEIAEETEQEIAATAEKPILTSIDVQKHIMNNKTIHKFGRNNDPPVIHANFIPIKDIASISDETLYNLLLNEFPLWLKESAAKRIIRI